MYLQGFVDVVPFMNTKHRKVMNLIFYLETLLH